MAIPCLWDVYLSMAANGKRPAPLPSPRAIARLAAPPIVVVDAAWHYGSNILDDRMISINPHARQFGDPAAEWSGRDGHAPCTGSASTSYIIGVRLLSKSAAPHPQANAKSREGYVTVRGAREHNLKNVVVDIPRDALVVFTGVSGSGKSSLAFGTLYAEAQRRYFESVAPYARRLIDQVGVPEVDSIEGLPPAVALQQQRGTPNARSSVGSVTTLSSLVRMLYSRTGTYPAKQPMLYAEDFSPNTVQGACPTCHGLGRVYDATEASMVPDPSLTIRERAVAAWPTAWHGQNLRDILVTLGYDVDTPWKDLPKKRSPVDLVYRRATHRAGICRLHSGRDAHCAQAQT